jgi:hypothetical protein
VPLLVGVGIDLGEAVPVEGGFRGGVLNTAARLCSKAAAGQVLVTPRMADRAGDIRGVSYGSAGSTELKGFESPVELIEAAADARFHSEQDVATASVKPLPLEIEPDSQMVDRESELSWLRGTWRRGRTHGTSRGGRRLKAQSCRS